MQKLKNPLFIVFCIVFVDVLGIGILIPVIPILLTDPSSPYHLLTPGTTLATGFILLGWLTALYPFMQFLATPILGELSDRFGRKPVLAISLFGTAISYVVFALGIMMKSLPILFLSRALDGITGGNISVAQAAIADSSAPEKRARNFGIIGAAFGIGFVVGPFLGGVLSDPEVLPWFDATTPFWFAAVLSLLNTLGVLFLFNETLKEKVAGRFHWLQSLVNIRKAALMQGVRRLFAASFLFQAGFSFFTTFFGAYMIYRFGFEQRDIGYYFAFIGICIALTQAFVTGFVGKRFSPHTIVSVGLLGVTLTVLSFSLVTESWMLYVVGFFQAISMGLVMANMTALISRSATPQQQGEVLGIGFSVQALAQSIPPVIAGYAAASLAPSAPIMVGSGFLFLAFLVFVFFARGASHAISGHGKNA